MDPDIYYLCGIASRGLLAQAVGQLAVHLNGHHPAGGQLEQHADPQGPPPDPHDDACV